MVESEECLEEDDLLAALFSPAFHAVLLVSALGEVRVYQGQTGQAVKQFRWVRGRAAGDGG